MNSKFGQVFLFLTNLAWKSRVTIPLLVTSVFLIMDIRLQIEINIQSGQGLEDFEELDIDDDDEDSDDEEPTESSSEDNSEISIADIEYTNNAVTRHELIF